MRISEIGQFSDIEFFSFFSDSLSEDRGSIPRTKFLQNFIRTLRNSDLDPGLPLRALVPRGYSTGMSGLIARLYKQRKIVIVSFVI